MNGDENPQLVKDWGKKIQQRDPEIRVSRECLKKDRDYFTEVYQDGSFRLILKRFTVKKPLVIDVIPTFKTKGQIYEEKKKAWLKTTKL